MAIYALSFGSLSLHDVRVHRSKFKVVVVGGGPAGSSAARTLAAAGIEVCLIDRSLFPREKLCGGLLTLRSKKAFEMIFQSDWSSAIQARARGAQFFYKEEWLKSVTDHKDIYFTCRRDYDAMLLELARKSGAEVILGRQVESINVARSSLTLSDNEEIEYDILIGADGVNSLVAKAIFKDSFDRNTIGFGLEMEIPVSPEIPAIAEPEIYFGLLRWGYGWVFPKRTTLTAGVGGLLKVNPNMRQDFEAFLKQRFGQVPAQKIKGHFIPFGDFRQTPGRGNMLLCGDAAGLVEPITGEGIAFAMLSGFHAAESAKEAIAQGREKSAMEYYSGRYETIAETFRQAKRLRRVLFPGVSQYLLSKVLPKSESIPRKQMDLMADELSYREYTQFLIKTGISGPMKYLFKR